MKNLTIALAFAAFAFVGPGRAAEISGAGSTFVYPVMAKWAAEYEAKTGNKVSYQSVGSGLGIAQIKSGSVDFGASDMPLKPAELNELGLGQFPLVIGGVVPAVNIYGVEAGEMRFTGRLLADIFLGNIKNWNDPAIRKINPELALPDLQITVVHRVDGSGTTFNFSNYLSKESPEWKARMGEGTQAWGTSHQKRPLEEASIRAKITPAVTFHILRHTHGSHLAMRGVPMGVIAAQLGHADTRMTEKHYAHLAPSYVAETIRANFPHLGIAEASQILAFPKKKPVKQARSPISEIG
jgi:hypothetical protein